MRFRPLDLPGTWLIDSDRIPDERGSFTREWDRDALVALGLDPTVMQISSARNATRGTLRGMHLQRAPGAENKVIRCTSGRIHDVLIDLRPDSTAHLRWVAVTLDADEPTAVYAPAGVAHGYLTLTDDTEVSYLISTPYAPDLAIGVRWDDPLFGIDWPFAPVVMSFRDRSFPDHRA